jgi:hypothetical protein
MNSNLQTFPIQTVGFMHTQQTPAISQLASQPALSSLTTAKAVSASQTPAQTTFLIGSPPSLWTLEPSGQVRCSQWRAVAGTVSSFGSSGAVEQCSLSALELQHVALRDGWPRWASTQRCASKEVKLVWCRCGASYVLDRRLGWMLTIVADGLLLGAREIFGLQHAARTLESVDGTNETEIIVGDIAAVDLKYSGRCQSESSRALPLNPSMARARSSNVRLPPLQLKAADCTQVDHGPHSGDGRILRWLPSIACFGQTAFEYITSQ